MKKIMKRIYVAVALIAASSAVNAQNTTAGYFTDGYLYRHHMNPAIGNDHSYFSLPALGNVNVGVNGNLGLSNVIFNKNNRTMTFLNKAVSTDEVMKGLKDNNRLGADVRLSILEVGFKAFGGYNTFGINVRANVNATVKKDLFSLAKEGATNNTYDLSGAGANALAFAEIAFGHSHQINEQLRVGAKAKVLIGGGNVNAEFNKLTLDLGEDNWIATADANIHASVKGLKLEQDINERTGHRYVSGAEMDGPGINGFGLGLDLGAEYKINDDIKVNAAVVDLGFISWKSTLFATTGGERRFETDDYVFNTEDSAPNNMDDEWDRLVDGLSRLYELESKGDEGSRTTGIGATLNIAGEYTLPSYRKLSFGVLSTTRMQKHWTWTEVRASANWAPAKFFSTSLSVAEGTFGPSFGFLVNLHPNGFNLYLGMDRIMGKVTKQYIPVNSRAHFNIGVNFPL